MKLDNTSFFKLGDESVYSNKNEKKIKKLKKTLSTQIENVSKKVNY